MPENRELKRARSSAAYRKNRAAVLARNRARYLAKQSEIQEYGRAYYHANREAVLAKQKARHNPEKKRAYDEEYRSRIEVRLRKTFEQARRRANRQGIPFTMTLGDLVWPRVCPVLGLVLDYGLKPDRHALPNSPSIDRIDPVKGYVPGNVHIISLKANLIKSNATPAELVAVAEYFTRLGRA